MKCIMAGSGSDIAQGLTERLTADGWEVRGITRNQMTSVQWDMAIICYGSLEPIGKFFDVAGTDWERGVHLNGLYPLRILRLLWLCRRPKATVVFLGGPNMDKPSPTYSAYRAGKAILYEIVGTLGEEYPDVRFRILNPGVVKTKIHLQTLAAGHKAANYERVMKIVNGTEATVSHDEVYRRLKDVIA